MKRKDFLNKLGKAGFGIGMLSLLPTTNVEGGG